MDPDELAAARRRELMRATAHLGPRPRRSPRDVPDITLAEFLLARLAEDEQRAPEIHEAYCASFVELEEGGYEFRSDVCGCGVPARVLAEVEAKRAILADHVNGNAGWDNGAWADDDFPLPAYCVRCEDRKRHDAAPWPCPTLRALALPYADHPECHPSWLPAVKA